ncbi:MAG TPA: hypothetical protein VJL28_00500 [Gemmatimonadaceae bacterium]|nr:hypothetical protein [Gemmatimonadaceae bacterium]
MASARDPDLERLARAVHLDAERLDTGAWRVTGGAHVHEVNADATACDCTDYAVRGRSCKHLLAVRLRSGDSEAPLRLIVVAPRRARRPVPA